VVIELPAQNNFYDNGVGHYLNPSVTLFDGAIDNATNDTFYDDGAAIPCAIYVDGTLKNANGSYFCLVYKGAAFNTGYKKVDVNHQIVAYLGDQVASTKTIRIGVKVLNPEHESVHDIAITTREIPSDADNAYTIHDRQWIEGFSVTTGKTSTS
jgi:hypothetical protein